MRFPITAALVLALACSGAAEAQTKTKVKAKPASTGGQAMISAANPMAVEAGLKVLRAGGTAADAAVAVQATLGLVEPQSSGLGGGGFMVFYDGATKEVTAYDGRETAPAVAGPDYFFKASGLPLGFEAVKSGRSVGAPGAIAMLALVQKEHGKLAWKDLFGEAEHLATDGFVVPKRLGTFSANAPPEVAAYLKGAKPGDILKNPAYAATIKTLATGGIDAFYRGPIAQQIAAKVAEGPISGSLTAADIAAYKPNKSPALCRPYRVYVVCAPPAPSGGSAVLMALGIYENTDIAAGGSKSAKSWYDFAEGQRLMYADRDQYVADPAFVPQPAGLLDAEYLKGRAALIGDKSEPRTAGKPPGAVAMGPDATNEAQGTSHFVIVDRWGNVVSMTTTVESVFGSGRMVGGFILNNQLTDFSQQPRGADGKQVANAVMGGKRPRSSMAPLIILDRKGNFVMAVGSPGGNSIPAYNLKAVVGFIDWKLPLADAIALPNLIARGPGTQGEVTKFDPAVLQGLAAKGIPLRAAGGEDSGLHAVAMVGGKLVGAADSRRDGVAKAP
jgi:gamma-glutamyltranspeptidase/glutathione hydrolase